MSYKVVQKVKGNFYLYEVESTWDPVSKKSRQTRRYIGKCDADGNLVDKARGRAVAEEPAIASKSFGQQYVMYCLARDAGLIDAVERTFGVRNGRILAGLFITRAVRPGPPAMSVDSMREGFLPELLGITDMEDWNTLRKILVNLGAAFPYRYEVFSELAGGGGAVVYELTSLTGDFEPLEVVRGDVGYGFSRFPKLKVYIAYSGDRAFYFGFASTEEGDEEALPSIDADVRGLGMDGSEFFLHPRVLEREAVERLVSTGLPFSVQAQVDSEFGRWAVANAASGEGGPVETFVYRGSVYRVCQWVTEIGSGPVRCVVLTNEKRRSDKILALYSRLEEAEKAICSAMWNDRARRDENRSLYFDVKNLFDIARGEDGSVRAYRREDAIKELENECGRSVFVTTSGLPWNRLVDLTARHNQLEFYLRQFKLDLEEGARFFSSVNEANGAFLQEFMAVAVRNELESRMREGTMEDRMSPMDVMSEMGKLKVSRVGDKWVLNEMTPLQRTMLHELGVPMPSDGVLNPRRGRRQIFPRYGSALASAMSQVGMFVSAPVSSMTNDATAAATTSASGTAYPRYSAA